MSKPKRKRGAEDAKPPDSGYRQQKKRRKSDSKEVVGNGEPILGLSRKDSTKIVEATADPDEQAVTAQKRSGKGSKDTSKAEVKANGASSTTRVVQQPISEDPSSQNHAAKVVSEEQAARTHKKPGQRRNHNDKQDRSKAGHRHSKTNGGPNDIKTIRKQKRSHDTPKTAVAEATAEEQAAKRQQRKEKRKEDKKKLQNISLIERETRKAAQAQRRLEKHEKRSQKQKSSAPMWRTSEPAGGCMLSIDLLFSPKEDCMLIAYDKSVCIYSASSSLLLRKLSVRKSEQISSFAFSPSDASQLFVSKIGGIIERWDWINGTLLDIWDTKTTIHSLASLDPSPSDRSYGLVYSLDKVRNHRWMITAHRLMAGENASESDIRTLLKYEEPINSLRILEAGKLIVASSGHKLLIGSTESPDQPTLKEVSYIWREITCSEWITSIDTRLRPVSNSSKKEKGTKAAISGAVDIVVGGLKGAMFIYEDLLGRLILKESKSTAGAEDNLTPRKLHWHRNAVSSVKWSVDGNYVISGGHETVLVIWQLETGHRQELPHLSAAIESIVVSPTGTSYGVRLADNSAMILSTTELQPTFSVAGIQLPAISRAKDDESPFVPTVDAPTEGSLPKQNKHFPVVGSPNTNQVLLAVPADTTSAISSRHACFLQTFDVISAQQVSRQALTRNKVTTLNMGPEQNIVEEPNVTHMRLSHDGKWLATVDEWMPPKRDLDHLAFNDATAKEEQRHRMEVYLKFWAWDDTTSSWELVSRINSPQQTSSSSAETVLDLCAHPSEVGFATVTEDGITKAWKPQTRKRHGQDVRSKEGQNLTSWDCRWTAKTPTMKATAAGAVKSSFSPDGSVLAVASSMTSAVYLIDATSGVLHSTRPAHFEGPIFGVGIVDRYLITLAKELRVWDLVTEELHYGFTLDLGTFTVDQQRSHTHLAVDQKHNGFAVALPTQAGLTSKGKSTGLRSRIAMFDVELAEPLFNTLQPNLTTSLLPMTGKKGYYCIDTAAEVRTLTSVQGIPEVVSRPPSGQRSLPSLGLGNIYGNGRADEEGQEQDVLKLTSGNIRARRMEEDDTKVVRPERLAEVFEPGSGFALPSVSDLFEKVAILFAGSGDG